MGLQASTKVLAGCARAQGHAQWHGWWEFDARSAAASRFQCAIGAAVLEFSSISTHIFAALRSRISVVRVLFVSPKAPEGRLRCRQPPPSASKCACDPPPMESVGGSALRSPKPAALMRIGFLLIHLIIKHNICVPYCVWPRLH